MPSLTTTGPVLLSTGLRPGPVQSLAPYASGPVVVAVPGPPGSAIPTGGTTGQTLIKASGADFDTAWAAPAGGSSAGEVRHDWAAPHSYMASAPAGTAESATGWRITRITVADAGTATVAVCLDGAWTTREGAIYG